MPPEHKSEMTQADYLLDALDMFSRTPPAPTAQAPIDMVLHCPNCGMQHLDVPEHWGGKVETHKSHLCVPAAGGCGHIWRPADVPTNGVAAVKTKGKADSPTAQASPALTELPPEVLEFDQFLNEPPENEHLRDVREFRHAAYRKWEKLLAQFRAALSQSPPAKLPAEAAKTALPRSVAVPAWEMLRYKRALWIACGNDPEKVKQAIQQADANEAAEAAAGVNLDGGTKNG